MREIKLKTTYLASIILVAVLTTSIFAAIFVGAVGETTITENSLLLTDGSNPMLADLDMGGYDVTNASNVESVQPMGYSYNDDETDMVTITGASETAIITFLSGSSPGGGIIAGFTSPPFQYLLEGDFIGFVLSCYTTTIGSTFYAISIFFVSAVIYIRQRSLFTVSIIWLFVGGTFIALFWEFSAVAVWFTLLGIAGLFAEFITVWRRGH